MKKIIIFLLVALIVPAFSIDAQAQKKKKSKKENSPVIEGKMKVRKTDYDSVWRFTTFNAKKKINYYCNYDYRQISEVVEYKVPEWGSFQPVVNYITTNPRAAVTLVAVYALNPAIDNDDEKAELSRQAISDALLSLADFEEWTFANGLKNKMVLRVAQVDYRYWFGNDYFNMEPPKDSIVRLGFVMALSNKKTNLFPEAAANARKFRDVKFLPNDATVVASYLPLLDSVADCVLGNDRYEVLLTGYSDNVGTVAYNKGLSNQRANEIKKLLMRRGVPEYRIEVVARGEEEPIGDNATYDGRLENNRVSVKIQ